MRKSYKTIRGLEVISKKQCHSEGMSSCTTITINLRPFAFAHNIYAVLEDLPNTSFLKKGNSFFTRLHTSARSCVLACHHINAKARK